ncbi:DUF7513 family protein [Halobacterium jilantaiense]|uniref:DUF7513 domain-containing protein n=1 Tax=Halobacterium jilantaiense TaxID=355548 RepID=A0A1I0NR90_9EURY|nr:hypothetical protein [Halobacterium jilantaiense]SEW04093.1 hypothetical protein SAMN04487945_1087 [Halobacterium jilantaiense]
MSVLEKYLAGWTFRSNYPTFDAGDEVELFVTGREDGGQIARVGDSKLRIADAPGDLLDKRVRLKITSFDDDAHVGEAEYVETVGESAF